MRYLQQELFGNGSGLLKTDTCSDRVVVGSKIFVGLAALSTAGLSLLSSAARGANYKLNCDGLGALEIREVVENDDLRSPLSDFLVISLPSGVEV